MGADWSWDVAKNGPAPAAMLGTVDAEGSTSLNWAVRWDGGPTVDQR
jgi:hypothetical protein